MELTATPQTTLFHSLVRRFVLLLLFLILAAPAFADIKKDRQKAQKSLRSGDFERAEQLYRDILKKDDRDAEARLGLSKALLKQRRLQDSFDHAARVIAVDPLSARAHSLLGAAILASGDFRLSIEEFRTALTLDGEEAMAIAGLAMVDFYENRTADALVKLRRAASIDVDEPDYLFSLGQAAARSERYKEAADAYERFLLIAPRTDAERRARIRGLIDFLRYLGQQNSLYNISGDRAVVPFEAFDNRPIVKIRINGSKTPAPIRFGYGLRNVRPLRRDGAQARHQSGCAWRVGASRGRRRTF